MLPISMLYVRIIYAGMCIDSCYQTADIQLFFLSQSPEITQMSMSAVPTVSQKH